MAECPFCAIRPEEIVRSNGAAIAFADRFPVSAGHTLVAPRRHVERAEDLPEAEFAQLFALVREVARDLAGRDGVDGVNAGFNSGAAAGQTVWHAHVHVFPRRTGDVPDPRGGVRRAIPSRAAYWRTQP